MTTPQEAFEAWSKKHLQPTLGSAYYEFRQVWLAACAWQGEVDAKVVMTFYDELCGPIDDTQLDMSRVRFGMLAQNICTAIRATLSGQAEKEPQEAPHE